MSFLNLISNHRGQSLLFCAVASLTLPVSETHGQFLQTVNGEVDTVSTSTTKFADAGYIATGIAATAEATFTKDSINIQESEDFRVGFRLLDSDGAALALATGGTVIYDDEAVDGDPDAGFTITTTGSVTETFAGTLQPAGQLDPVEEYRVEAVVFVLGVVFDPLSGTFVSDWVEEDSQETAAASFIHFTGDSSTDDALNVLTVLNAVSFTDRTALAGADPASAAHAFAVTANTTLHRFDAWSSPIAPADITVIYDLELWRRDAVNGDEQIPLLEDRITVTEAVDSHDNSWIDFPYEETVNHALEIVPDAVQLDSVNEVYYVRVTVSHIEDPVTSTEWAYGNRVDSADTQLMHFNGSLFFDNTETTLLDFSNDPAGLASWTPAYVTGQLADAEGVLTGSPGYTYSGAGPTIRLEPDGTARVVTPSSAVSLSPPASPDMDAAAGIRFKRQGLTLDHGASTGLEGSLTVYLPTGMGWAPTANQHAFDGTLTFPGTAFTQDLQPQQNSYSFSTGSPIHVVEETKPLGYEANTITWEVTNGLVQTAATGTVSYLREDELAALESAPVTAGEQIKRSNEQYYRGVGTLANTTILVEPGASGEALLTAEINFNSSAFRSHFPYDVGISHTLGFMALKRDLVDVDASYLDGLNVLSINYNQACVGDDCGTGTLMQEMRMVSAADRFRFTTDGGLVTTGPVQTAPSIPDTLAWGYINTLAVPDYHHQTSAFGEAGFHMPGHFIRGDENTGPSSNQGPGVILYSGHVASDPTQKERPGTPAYAVGAADYAGFNYRTGSDGAVVSDSRIAGVEALFDLTGRSKYYIRPAGVTGIHEAVPGTFPDSMVLYGYQMTFTQYGLNYRMNDPDESRTEGAVDLPYPSDFIQEFEEMAFTCLGGLDSARVPSGGGDQTMSYWLANITINTIDFASENACNPEASTFLLAGVSAEAAYVDVPLYGTLGFLADGQLMIPSSSTLEVNSRLHLPTVVEFKGPTRQTDPNDANALDTEVYQLVPATLAYYNDYASTSEQAQGDGKINFAGTLDVAFFEDLEVHLQTSPRTVSPSQSVPVHLMGGWSESGDTFFNSTGFDPDNTGFPDGVSETVYRNDAGNGGDPTPYLIHARQDWLGVVNFDYPLAWSNSTRSFESYEPKTNDLLVISAEHQLDYLSAETAHLSIGITYDGMPEVSVTNFVINEVDKATGVYQSLLVEAKKPVVDSIEEGIDKMAGMLEDRMDSLYDQFFAQAVETNVVNPIYSLLHDAATATVPTYDPALVNQVVTSRIKTGSNSMQELIGELGSGVASANYLFTEIDGRLADIEFAIDALINGIDVDTLGNPVPTPTVDSTYYQAFLAKNLNGDFEVLVPLVERLLDELAPDISDELNTLLAGAVDDLNARINDLFEEAKPTIDQIVVVLTDLRQVVGEVRTAIAPAGELIVEIETVLNNASSEIDSLTSDMLIAVETIFATLSLPEQFLSYSEEEIKSRIRTEVRDLFFGTDFIADIQVTLKQHLYDVDAAINDAIAQAFAEINDVLRDLVSEALAGVDDSINGFLGDIESVVGAGKLNGYGQFNGDALRRLHIDLYLQLKVPDEMEFNGYLTIEQMDSEGNDTCSPGAPGGAVTEVTMGATDVPADWISPDLRVSVEGKFNFQSDPNFKLLGLGGSFELTSGEINFETFKITDMGAAIMFGASENYLAAKLGLAFNSYEAFGGVFFGRTCSLDPILLADPDVETVVGQPNPTFTGVYVYGECHIPVSEAALGIPASCFFRISAGVGAGAFYFVEGNTLGGKIYASASGEALCVVSIRGEVTLIGAVSNGELRFNGTGRLSGEAGACPFCIKFGKSAEITYEAGSWNVDI
jgi:hypothetical protein